MLQSLSIHQVLALALCNDQGEDAVSFGDGIEISLARAGDQVAAPEWVQVLPIGPHIEARDGRKFILTNPAALLANLRAKTAELAMDVEHATEIKAPKGEEAPAQGWAKEYDLRADGIWAKIDWTPGGAKKVADKEYRYVSPAIRHTPSGEIVSLSSFALTTQPALVMPALASDQRRKPNLQLDPKPMSTLLSRLVAALGLTAAATEDDVVTAATTQVSLARDARDPKKLVPAADLETALARAVTAEGKLAEVETAGVKAKAEATVDEAIAAGKIAPASREHWISLCAEKPDSTGQIIAAMPAVLTPPTKKDAKIDGADKDELGLTDAQTSLCRDNGWDPKAYAATLKETV